MILHNSTAGLLISLQHIGAERLENLYHLHGKPWVNHRMNSGLLQSMPSPVGDLVVPGARGLSWLQVKATSPKHALYGLCLRRAAEQLPEDLHLLHRSNNKLVFAEDHTLLAYPFLAKQTGHPKRWVAYPKAPNKPYYINIDLHSNQPKPLEHFLQQLVNDLDVLH